MRLVPHALAQVELPLPLAPVVHSLNVRELAIKLNHWTLHNSPPISELPNYFAGVRVIFSGAVVFVILPGVVLVGNSVILVLLEELE